VSKNTIGQLQHQLNRMDINTQFLTDILLIEKEISLIGLQTNPDLPI
jgi:predicted oxidoreductase